MKPIINPWLIYLIDLFDNFNGLLTGALILLGGAVVGLLLIWFLVLWIMNRMITLLLHVKSI